MKSGSILLLGPTNSGKSTLLNKIVGKRVTMVSRKQQSTTFNQVSQINSVSYYLDGDSTSFSTTINLEIEINSIDLVESDDSKLYSFTLSNGLDYQINV